jgi:hypothetical protein
MIAAHLVRFGTFFAMAILVSVTATLSLAAAAGAAVMAFGYGVAEICDAISKARKESVL